MRLDPHITLKFCAALLLAGCSTPPGASTDGVTSTMTEGVASTTTGGMTEPGPVTTTDAPTTTSDRPTTSEGTTTGEQPAGCASVAAELTKQAEQYCECPFVMMDYPDVQTCLDEGFQEDVVCECEQYAADPGNPGYGGCFALAEAAYTGCIAQLTCEQLEADFDCIDAYLNQLDSCGEPTKASDGDVYVECYMDPGFKCGSGETIPEFYTCDAEDDCADKSDEADAACLFTCGSGEQIPTHAVCDGEPDCMDMSDEIPGACLFTCDDGGEIPKEWVCDGEPDCRDMTDELVCN